MKEEARFQIRGRVERAYDKVAGKWQIVCLTVKAAAVKDGAEGEYEVEVWDDQLKELARACKGKAALLLGRIRSRRNENGYVNPRFSLDAIMVEPAAAPVELRRGEPGTVHAAGATAPTPHRQAKANGYQPQPEDPLPWEEENMAKDDIPF